MLALSARRWDDRGLARRVVFGLILSALLFVPLGLAARATVSANGVISGSGTSYTLTVQNTGDQAIRCLRFFTANNIQVTSVSGPQGAISAPGGNGFGSISSGALIAPGATASWRFTTNQTYPANAGGELHVSADCQQDIVSRASGPSTEGPCQCENLDATIVPKSIFFLGAGELGHLHLEFTVKWTLTCSAGTGGCSATLSLKTAGGKLKPSVSINCTAKCGGTRTGSKHFKLIGGAAYDSKHRPGKTLSVIATRTCTDGPETKTFTFVFNKIGQVDKKKSKLK